MKYLIFVSHLVTLLLGFVLGEMKSEKIDEPQYWVTWTQFLNKRDEEVYRRLKK